MNRRGFLSLFLKQLRFGVIASPAIYVISSFDKNSNVAMGQKFWLPAGGGSCSPATVLIGTPCPVSNAVACGTTSTGPNPGTAPKVPVECN